MSLELRVCQESLAKARMDRKADPDAGDDAVAASQRKVYEELMEERDYWRREAGLLWQQVRALQLEIAAWTKEAEYWKEGGNPGGVDEV